MDLEEKIIIPNRILINLDESLRVFHETGCLPRIQRYANELDSSQMVVFNLGSGGEIYSLNIGERCGVVLEESVYIPFGKMEEHEKKYLSKIIERYFDILSGLC